MPKQELSLVRSQHTSQALASDPASAASVYEMLPRVCPATTVYRGLTASSLHVITYESDIDQIKRGFFRQELSSYSGSIDIIHRCFVRGTAAGRTSRFSVLLYGNLLGKCCQNQARYVPHHTPMGSEVRTSLPHHHHHHHHHLDVRKKFFVGWKTSNAVAIGGYRELQER